MVEYFDVLTSDRKPTGRKLLRGTPLGENDYRNCAEIWVFAPDGRLMVTRRHQDKSDYPLYWECTAGLVRAGETTLQAILREASEEIGVKFRESDIKLLLTKLTHRNFVDIYTAVTDQKEFILQPDEVIDYRFVTKDELIKMNEDGIFVPFIYDRVIAEFEAAQRLNGLI